MDEQLPKKSPLFGKKALIGIIAIFFFLLLLFCLNFFGIYNLSEKVNFLRFLPTKEDPLVWEVNTIANIIQYPDSHLIAKYNIPRKQIEDEQALILCGGYPTSDRTRDLDETKCLQDSLVGIGKTVKIGDFSQALTLIKKLYPTVRNASFDDRVAVRMSSGEALRLDPEKQFLAFPPDGSQPLYGGSSVKQNAAIEMIKLFYLIKKK